MKAHLRQGMDEFFPPASYIKVLEKLMQGPTRFSTIAKITEHNRNTIGVKLRRMQGHGLINKSEFGMYMITEYGKKVLMAVDAYKKEMNNDFVKVPKLNSDMIVKAINEVIDEAPRQGAWSRDWNENDRSKPAEGIQIDGDLNCVVLAEKLNRRLYEAASSKETRNKASNSNPAS